MQYKGCTQILSCSDAVHKVHTFIICWAYAHTVQCDAIVGQYSAYKGDLWPLTACYRNMLIFTTAADNPTWSVLLLSKQCKTTCPSFLSTLLALSSSEETCQRRELGVWCRRTRQEKAHRQRTKATVWHVTITHPREMVSGGVCV